MLLIVEEGIREGICQAIYHYETANNKYMKNYNKNVISSFLKYVDANNLYGWECLENYLLENLDGQTNYQYR